MKHHWLLHDNVLQKTAISENEIHIQHENETKLFVHAAKKEFEFNILLATAIVPVVGANK